jgi:putative membrane protein
MRGFVIRAAIVAVGLWVASSIVPGVEVRSGGALIAAAVLLAAVNAIVRPILIILTLPITLLTLGLFLLVLNGLMVELVSSLLHGFYVAGIWPAIWTAIIVSITGWLVNGFIGPQGKIEIIEPRRY